MANVFGGGLPIPETEAQSAINAAAAAASALAAAISEANAAASALAALNSEINAAGSASSAATAALTTDANVLITNGDVVLANSAADAAAASAALAQSWTSMGFGGTLLDLGFVTDATVYFPTDLGVLP